MPYRDARLPGVAPHRHATRVVRTAMGVAARAGRVGSPHGRWRPSIAAASRHGQWRGGAMGTSRPTAMPHGGHGWVGGIAEGKMTEYRRRKKKMCRCQRSNGTFFEEGRRSGTDGKGEGPARETSAIDEIADGVVVPSEADLGGVRGNDSDRGVLDFGIGPAIGFSIG